MTEVILKNAVDVSETSNYSRQRLLEKQRFDEIEAEWNEKNVNEILKHKDKAKISCVVCYKLEKKADKEFSDKYEDYQYCEFVKKEATSEKQTVKGRTTNVTIGYHYLFTCPLRNHKHAVYIELDDELEKTELKEKIEELKLKLKEREGGLK